MENDNLKPKGLMDLPIEIRQEIFTHVIAIPLYEDVEETAIAYETENPRNIISTIAIQSKMPAGDGLRRRAALPAS